MRIYGFYLKSGVADDKSYSISIYRKDRCVGMFQFLWGYAKLFKFVRKDGEVVGMQQLRIYYNWNSASITQSLNYPPGYDDVKILEKALRYLRFSLFLDKIFLRNR